MGQLMFVYRGEAIVSFIIFLVETFHLDIERFEFVFKQNLIPSLRDVSFKKVDYIHNNLVHFQNCFKTR